MKPRVEIVAVEASTDIRTFVRAVSENGYSRIPVYDDNIDNIIGLWLHAPPHCLKDNKRLLEGNGPLVEFILCSK